MKKKARKPNMMAMKMPTEVAVVRFRCSGRELLFARIIGMRMAMATNSTTPMASQAQEKMSSSARAHRRAMMEPIPNTISARPRTTYMPMAGTSEPMGMRWSCGTNVWLKAMKKPSRPAKKPSRMVSPPKIMRPVVRSL